MHYVVPGTGENSLDNIRFLHIWFSTVLETDPMCACGIKCKIYNDAHNCTELKYFYFLDFIQQN